MSKESTIEGTTEAWESRKLGNDENYVERVEVDEKELDDALELQLISIRLQKSLIEDFKLIAKINGIGYQPLMRQILKRFADAEMKNLLRECALKVEKEEEAQQAQEQEQTKEAC